MNIKILENLKTVDLKNINIDKKIILILFGSVLICLSTGIIGKLTISPESLIWYNYLFKPALNPPAWLFQGIWMILYLLMGVSLYIFLKKESFDSKKLTLIIFGSQFLLNALWVPVFFGLRSIAGGFAIIILLWAAIYLTIYKFYKVSIPAALLLTPSLLWVSYTVGLNLSFWIWNA